MKTVIDTNVLVGSLLSGQGVNRSVIKYCFEGKLAPQISNSLFMEYSDVFSRNDIIEKSLLPEKENQDFLDDFLSVCIWNDFYFRWRPNLRDEGDNHIVELALASGSSIIVTHNIRDFRYSELKFPELKILTPAQILEHF